MSSSLDRPLISGKFLRASGQPFVIKGVSYGTFAPGVDGALFPAVERVASDFDAIVDLGANSVRTYTPPPVALLDEAADRSLRAIIGLPWMQHLAFLDRRADEREIRRSVRDHVRRLASHPAAMVFALGNEIPPSVVRWYGRSRIEQFLGDLYDDAKSAAPDALLTYVNYPPTDYLETPFFDICAFNVFLHAEDELRAYIARLHHLAGARPLLISELGADSLRNGEAGQSALVRLQARTALQEGACGAVVFTWTDDWWRGGHAVEDWAFGLVDAERRPKTAYGEVRRIFRGPLEAPPSPRVSVVVCAYNSAATIGECLDALQGLTYPDFEVIVVNDGSTDGTGAIAAAYPAVRVIETPNNGLSAARNVGLQNATGEIVAYTDADVRVDPEWLTYLVRPFAAPDVGAAGGPAIVPEDDPWFAQCVARAPGGPTPVLLDDQIAEHVPGCNCAFRREALLAIGGFNPVFLRAGDDVDVCWRIQTAGWKVGFAPAALVWHRHRSTTRAYWRQQVGYAEGEAWLAREHRDKFVRGAIDWRGHIYSPLPFVRSLRTTRINAGPFGTAAFPSVYRTDANPLAYLPHSGRWQVGWMASLAAAAGFAPTHPSWALVFLSLAVVTVFTTIAKCVQFGWQSDLPRVPASGASPEGPSVLVYRLAIAWLHFVQPIARLWGRARGVLHPPASHGRANRERSAVLPGLEVTSPADLVRLCLLRPVEVRFWSQRWIDVADLLRGTANRLRQQRAVRMVEADSGWWEDRDLTVSKRAWFRLDVRALLEEHGGGKCLHRFAVRPRLTMAAAFPLLAALAAAAVLQYLGTSWLTAAGIVGALLLVATLASLLGASRVVLRALVAEATDGGMARVSGRRRRSYAATAIHSLLPASLSRATRGLHDDSDDSRALVGDLRS